MINFVNSKYTIEYCGREEKWRLWKVKSSTVQLRSVKEGILEKNMEGSAELFRNIASRMKKPDKD
jgi:hypothetical protein